MEVRTLANIKSAIKRAELNVKQNEKNSAQKSAMRTAIKAFEANPSEELFRAASSAIDKAETKGLIHKNKASRIKLVFQLNLLNKKQSIKAVFLSSNQKKVENENSNHRIFWSRQVNSN